MLVYAPRFLFSPLGQFPLSISKRLFLAFSRQYATLNLVQLHLGGGHYPRALLHASLIIM
jgi:hypothetical protein